MRYLKHTLFLSIFLLVFFALTPISHSSNIKVGFIGGRSPVGIVKQWTPLLDYLTRKVGQPFEMALFENYQDLMGAFEQKQIDIFESGAFTHLVAMDGGDAEFLAGPVRMGSPSYRSIFIVRSDSDIERLDDLKGTSLALTDELSTSGFLLPRVMLKRKGITTPAEFFEQIVLTGSHNRSIEAVLEGAVNVAGVGDSFLAHLKPESREKLRILETSGPISYGPVTVRRDLNSAIKNKIRSALLNYHKHLSADIKQVVQIDRFTNDETWDYASLRAYRDETKALPKLGYVAPYRRVPTVISDRIEDEKESALTWVISIFAVVVIILIAALRVLKRRMSSTTGITITAIVALFAALFTTINLLTLFSSINEFATRRLGQMENLNLRTVTAITGTSAESLNNILSTATRDKALVWAKIFRNGTIIASNKPSEVGVSIIDQIRTDTFDKSGDETIQVLDPIIVGKKRFATVQLGLSFAPVSGMVKRAVTINAIAMVAALLAGLVGALAIRRRIGRPVKELSQAVEKMREGETVEIANTDADLKGVTNLIAMLGKELRDKQTLIDLNSYEKLNNDAEYDPELTKLIADRLHELEEDYPRFKKIRAKQAVGDSPAWLRCMRDAAIRASDPDPTVIIGPSGSGKTSVARVIHALSPRAEKPMGEFNCAEFASADPLVVLGKLFGYGTDCGIQGIDREGQKGILEEFDGGTIFFDEVGILPLQAQHLLLLPLEGRSFNPAAGKGEPKMVNVRFIFATNEPLEELVNAGKMRHDFLRRIQSRGSVSVPPLAQRREDIDALAKHFLSLRNARQNKTVTFAPETISLLTQFNYDLYNVSELLGEVNRAFDHTLFEQRTVIEPELLSTRMLEMLDSGLDGESTNEVALFDDEERKELSVLRKEQFNITRAERRLGYTTGSKTLTNRFRGLVYRTLDRTDWNVDEAASEIGGPHIDPRTYEKLKKKITNYVFTVQRHVDANTSEKLFNNLPHKYHIHIEDVVQGNIILSGIMNGS